MGQHIWLMKFSKFLLRNFCITVWFGTTGAGFQSYSVYNLLQGLDGRGFVGIHFRSPVLTSTRAGITATTMCGGTGCFTNFNKQVMSSKFELVAIFPIVL